MKRLSAVLAVGGMLIFGACGDLTEIPAPTGAAPPVTDQATPAPALDGLTRALAAGLRDAEVRRAVRDDMRSSPYGFHKLYLQDYAATPGGAALLAAAARNTGTSEQSLRSLLASLPQLEFYTLLREHRMTWRGGQGVAVVAPSETERAAAGYADSGERISYRFTTPEAFKPRHTVFVLQVSEWGESDVLPVRANPVRTPGSVIQDRADDEMATIAVDEAGRVVKLPDVATLPGAGGASRTVTSAVEAGAVGLFGFSQSDCNGDSADCWPFTMEIEHKTWIVDQYSKNTVSGGSLLLVRTEGVKQHEWYTTSRTLRSNSPWWGTMLKVYVSETDSGADDHYGPFYFGTPPGQFTYWGLDPIGPYAQGTFDISW